MREILKQGTQDFGIGISEGQLDQLLQFAADLEEQGKVMNLTAIKDPAEVARLHFLDSIAIGVHLPLGGKKVIDIGSGAGFPGIPLKIMWPGMELTTLDSVAKKIGFQEYAVKRLAFTDIHCIAGRAEELCQDKGYREQFDIAVSRAVTTVNVLCELCLPFVKVGGLMVAMKTPESAEREIAEADHALKELCSHEEMRIDYPIGDAVHTLVLIRKDGSSPAKYPRRFSRIKSNPL